MMLERICDVQAPDLHVKDFTLFSMINLGSCIQPHPIRIQALTLFLSLA